MKNKFCGCAFLFFLLLGVSWLNAQKNVLEPTKETPRERFYRKGGKETRAKIISNGGELTAIDIHGNRDLSLYEDGGHFNCRRWQPPAPGQNCDLKKLRDFLWSHWREKVRAYVRITGDSVDAVSTSHIFIEPGNENIWHISWRIARHMGEITDIPTILDLAKRTSKSSDDCWKKCEDGSDVLSFIDWEGEEIQVL
jgi:hypothetical protein